MYLTVALEAQLFCGETIQPWDMNAKCDITHQVSILKKRLRLHRRLGYLLFIVLNYIRNKCLRTYQKKKDTRTRSHVHIFYVWAYFISYSAFNFFIWIVNEWLKHFFVYCKYFLVITYIHSFPVIIITRIFWKNSCCNLEREEKVLLAKYCKITLKMPTCDDTYIYPNDLCCLIIYTNLSFMYLAMICVSRTTIIFYQ